MQAGSNRNAVLNVSFYQGIDAGFLHYHDPCSMKNKPDLKQDVFDPVKPWE